MKKQFVFVFIAMATLFITSCRKQENQLEPPEQKREPNPDKIYQKPSTLQEKRLVANLEKVGEVLKVLYLDQHNLKLVNASIFSKVYTDESILLKDLIFPESSLLPLNKRFVQYSNSLHLDLNKFAAQFWVESRKRNDSDFLLFLNEQKHSNVSLMEIDNGGYRNDVSIYFPYHEEFEVPDPNGGGGYYAPITTISAATAEADEGWGQLPYYINGVFQYYKHVVINDDYCFENPSHIVGVNGIEMNDITIMEAPPPPLPPPGVNRVYVGWTFCKKQYDALISTTGNGGGSEIQYCRVSGYLAFQNQQVTTFQDQVDVWYSRRNIRKRDLRVINAIWHSDWVPADKEQVFAIWEEDTEGEKTISGSLNTTVTVVPGTTIGGTIGFSTTVKTKDDIIRQLKISRHAYFADAFNDQGWEFSDQQTFLPPPPTHGWPWYDGNRDGGANVVWTWPYKVTP